MPGMAMTITRLQLTIPDHNTENQAFTECAYTCNIWGDNNEDTNHCGYTKKNMISVSIT